ncbi:MAG: hypothetical protein WCO28_10650 [Bacteroidota bacterium]
MKTKYIGIESICIINNSRVTIACNIMFEGKFYDEPIYTNIFCDDDQLLKFLELEKSPLCEKIFLDIKIEGIFSDDNFFQVDIPQYFFNQKEWKFETMVNLKISENKEIPFECYSFENL